MNRFIPADPHERPWNNRPFEMFTGGSMLASGFAILVSGGDWAPSFFQRSGSVVSTTYGASAFVAGLAILYGLYEIYRESGVYKLNGYITKAFGMLLAGVFLGAFVWGYLSNPAFRVPSSFVLNVFLLGFSLACFARGVYLLRTARKVPKQIQKALDNAKE